MADITFNFRTVRAAVTELSHSLREKLANKRIAFGQPFIDRMHERAAKSPEKQT